MSDPTPDDVRDPAKPGGEMSSEQRPGGLDLIGPRNNPIPWKREVPIPLGDSDYECAPPKSRPLTWRETLADAQAGIDRAYEHRRATVQAAWDAGLSTRKIAEVIGISAAGVHRIIGKQSAGRDADALLDSPASGDWER